MPMLRTIKQLFRANDAIVLMYHRIADIDTDPWDLAVTPGNFAEHLQLLKHQYNVVPVSELVRQLNKGRVQKNTVCITFDDGYQDNFTNALPLLKKYECPATFYIATGFTDQKKLFWWDILTQIFLVKRKLPTQLHLNEFNFTLENNGEITDEQLEKHRKWKWPALAPTQRCAIYLSIWEYLKPLPSEELLKVIALLTDWSGITHQSTQEDLPMTSGQLSMITGSKLFSLGAHTMNHPALGTQRAAVQHDELAGSRSFLYQQFDNYSDTVAYPYGHYNNETLQIMKNENFEAGLTTEEKPVNIKSNIYSLGRFQVKNQTAAELNQSMFAWKTK